MNIGVPPSLLEAGKAPVLSSSGTTSERDHAHMLTVFSVSAGMVGVCLTTVGLIQVMENLKNINTLCDEILVFDALMFLGASVSSYWSLHHRFQKHYRRMRLTVDTMLMVGIVLMVVVCGMIAYTITEQPRPLGELHVEDTARPVSGEQP